MMIDYVSERKAPDIRIISPSTVFELLKRFRNKKQEHFIAVLLDSVHNVLRVKIVSIGTLDRTIVHPREVFKQAVVDSAAAVILAHNHPSGNCEPSQDDIAITKRLKEAGEILGIPVLDHVIIGKGNYRSFQESGLM